MIVAAAAPDAPARSDWTAVALLAAGFGLVGVDRFMISTLFPVISRDLHLDYADIGVVTGALAFAWGAAALVMGNRADRLGRRVVLVGSMLVFALLIGASGLATGLAGLVAVRIVMGLADGAFTPASIAATIEAASADRRGLAIGIEQMMLPAIGLGVAPLLIAALLHLVDWRWVFVIFAVPGLLVAALMARRLPAKLDAPVASDTLADWRAVLRHRNVRLLMGCMLCWLTCLVTTSAFLPNYLTDHLRLSFGAMSGVMSAIGIGSAVGTVTLAALSDRIGRRPVMIGAAAGACAAVVLLGQTGPQPALLFALLFAVHFCNNAAITLTVGPLCIETVGSAMAATASGMVIACGEFFGGGLAPVLAGQVASRFGIAHLLWLPAGALALGIVLATLLTETRPRSV